MVRGLEIEPCLEVIEQPVCDAGVDVGSGSGDGMRDAIILVDLLVVRCCALLCGLSDAVEDIVLYLLLDVVVYKLMDAVAQDMMDILLDVVLYDVMDLVGDVMLDAVVDFVRDFVDDLVDDLVRGGVAHLDAFRGVVDHVDYGLDLRRMDDAMAHYFARR